MLLRATAVSNI